MATFAAGVAVAVALVAATAAAYRWSWRVLVDADLALDPVDVDHLARRPRHLREVDRG